MSIEQTAAEIEEEVRHCATRGRRIDTIVKAIREAEERGSQSAEAIISEQIQELNRACQKEPDSQYWHGAKSWAIQIQKLITPDAPVPAPTDPEERLKQAGEKYRAAQEEYVSALRIVRALHKSRDQHEYNENHRQEVS